MRRRPPWLLPALIAGIAGCASLRTGGDPEEARDRLAEAAAELERGDFRSAYPELSWIYSRCPHAVQGREALLLMAASELDPRNDARRVDVASALSAEYLALPAAPPLRRPIAQTLYLLGLELGASVPSQPLRSAHGEAVTELRRDCRSETGEPPATPVSAAARPSTTGGTAAANQLATPTWLPELPGASVPTRIAALTAERDSLAAQVQALVQQLNQLQQRVAQQQEELERIRKTLRP